MLNHQRRAALLCSAGVFALATPISAFYARPSTAVISAPISHVRPTCSMFNNNNPRRTASTSAAINRQGATVSRHGGERGGNRPMAASGGGAGTVGGDFYAPKDLDSYCAPWGVTLRYRGTLNSYRIEAFRENGELAGYTTGFYLGDLLHLDKVQIQRKASEYEPGAPNAPSPGTRDLPWAEKTGNLIQLGAVLGCAAVRYGWDRGAKKVELLAIRENDKQHSRLVRYYRIAGFRADREVGEDLGSLKDRLLWGAEGTLMTAGAEDFLRRWTPQMVGTSDRGLTEAEADTTAAERQEV